MTHWAAGYPGLPYRAGADGPDAFDCWGLVRHVFRHRFGIEFPPVIVGDDGADNVKAIKQSARVSGMRPLPAGTPPAEGDIVIMRSRVRLHCGVALELAGRVCVLHAAHECGVVRQNWRDATEGMTVDLWRKPA